MRGLQNYSGYVMVQLIAFLFVSLIIQPDHAQNRENVEQRIKLFLCQNPCTLKFYRRERGQNYSPCGGGGRADVSTLVLYPEFSRQTIACFSAI